MKQTPFAAWREKGEKDPHGDLYSGSKGDIACGHRADVLILAELSCDIVSLTVGKERIRWLSRRLYALAEDHTSYNEQRATLVHGELTDDELANAFYLCEHPYIEAAKDRILWLSEAVRKLEPHQELG